MATEEAGKLGAPGRGGTDEARHDRAGGRAGRADGGSGPEHDDLLEVALTPAEVLAALARLDVEAALAYEAAAGLADDDETVRQLRRFGRDHRRHAEVLARLIGEREAEREPAQPVLPGLARVAAGLGPGSLTLALLANEQLTNLAYEDVLAYAWDEAVERLLMELRADEERHLRWLSERHGLSATPAPADQGT
ncbi:ferritin-like domain-containing protein [Anaeromyxobacter sp. Fw109-5]|uniref:ferritin-like domain-containing protein n=1 Tax=Anaeromyxobacter sp. (strain Fw109-5) TaxID=404589 RepID=UPI0003069D8E|nr:ferritin-like domain-containing protein [Anaeromyxobacter sp. Fw109-5]